MIDLKGCNQLKYIATRPQTDEEIANVDRAAFVGLDDLIDRCGYIVLEQFPGLVEGRTGWLLGLHADEAAVAAGLARAKLAQAERDKAIADTRAENAESRANAAAARVAELEAQLAKKSKE